VQAIELKNHEHRLPVHAPTPWRLPSIDEDYHVLLLWQGIVLKHLNRACAAYHSGPVEHSGAAINQDLMAEVLYLLSFTASILQDTKAWLMVSPT
jgi:hypothetical protein